MSAAVIAIPTMSTKFPDASAARKRRREILASQRSALESTITPAKIANYEDGHVKKARRVSDISEPVNSSAPLICSGPITAVTLKKSTNTKKKVSAKKKPQMKYDPDVPMSKEEAAAWRREQRRKRNRESAALSRQRQRDRIGDLEVEVDQLKTKVQSIMDRIKSLEDASGIDSSALVPEMPHQERTVEQTLHFEVVSDSESNESKFVSPPSSPCPEHLPLHDEPQAFPITSSSAKTVVDAVVDQVLMGIESYEQEFSDNMISRHAVKINTVAPALPFLPKSEDSVTIMPTPEDCLSGDVATQVVESGPYTANKSSNVVSGPTTTLDPIDSSLFPVKDEVKLPVLLSDEENEDEFGEFLLDAVQWL